MVTARTRACEHLRGANDKQQNARFKLRSAGLHLISVAIGLSLTLSLLLPGSARATELVSVSPQGEVEQVQQVVLRFAQPMVALGDSMAAAPAKLSCTGVPVLRSTARWQNERVFSFELDSPLPAGSRCTVQMLAKPNQEYRFSTGGPRVQRTQPYEGSEVEEEQHFVLSANGAVDFDSVAANSYCIVKGIAERIPLQIVQRDPLAASAQTPVTASNRARGAQAPGHSLTVRCQRPLPPDTPLTVVWGKGVRGVSGVARSNDQRLQFKTRARFTASFSCERAQANQPCTPLSPMRVEFSAPVDHASAQAIRLLTSNGELRPRAASAGSSTPAANEPTSSVEFAPTYQERAEFRLVLPSGLTDQSGRQLSNATLFPMTVRTGELPPLAKFASAPFGIIEWSDHAALPITLRNVESDLNVSTASSVHATSEVQVIEWLKHLNRFHEREIQTGVDAKKQAIMTPTRSLSLLRELERPPAGPRIEKIKLPAVSEDRRPFEVVGVPLKAPGFYLVEVESLRLGQALLERNAPMYVRTGALVTNLAVHSKLGRENALVWVTTLDRGTVVADAAVRAFGCDGKLLWEGRTNADGIARIDQPLSATKSCDDWDGGLLISARKSDSRQREDFSFVLTNWNQGIESWRFNLPNQDDTQASVRAHTVFDRTLLRAGETVSMKHFVRTQTAAGLALVPTRRLANRLRIVHLGSDLEYTQDLVWQGGRFSASQFKIPKDAKLGVYQVSLERAPAAAAATAATVSPSSTASSNPSSNASSTDDEATLPLVSGQFRVEEFRLPVLAGQIATPKATQVAVSELPVDIAVNYLSGGAAAQLPVQVSALIRRRSIHFADYDAFNFDVRDSSLEAEGISDEPAAGTPANGATAQGEMVLDRQALTLSAQGTGRMVIGGLKPAAVTRELVVEASYNDPNGEIQTLAQTVALYPADVLVGVTSERWVSVSDQLKVRSVVLTPSGQPTANALVEVRALQIKRSSTRKRLVGGLYSYENRVEKVDLGLVCSGRSNKRGEFDCAAPAKGTGEIILMATARDANNRVAQADASVWVSAEGDTWFEAENHDRIDLLPEKKRYEPGQTARLQVRMPFRYATALVAIEREGIIDTRVVQLSGRTPSIDLKIDESWGPNVYVSVLALRGRLREVPWYSMFTWGWRSPTQWWQARQSAGDYTAATATVDLAKPAYKLGIAELRVGLAARELKVVVTTDKPRYDIRQTALATFKVTAADGKPAPAGTQLAVAVVDEALLELAENPSWRLLDSMMQRRGYGVDNATAQMQVVGKRHFGRKAAPAGGGGGRAPTRELFDTLLLWRAQLDVNAQGQAHIEIPINDSLSRFKVVALADSPNQLFGTGAASFRTSQDLQLISGLPPLIREQDRYSAMATIRNGSERLMKLVFSAKGNAIAAVASSGAGANEPLTNFETALELAPGEARELSWPVNMIRVGLRAVAWELTVRDSTSNAADRLRIEQRVLPAIPETVTQASLFQLEPGRALPAQQPIDSLPARGGVRVQLQQRLSEGLPSVRRYFEAYPFVCLEQKTSKSIGLRDISAWQAVVAELPAYLDADGLADYFPVGGDRGGAGMPGGSGTGSDSLTAYLLSVSDEASKLNPQFALPEAVRARMELALVAFVEGKLRRDTWAPRRDQTVRRIAALEALSRRGKVTASLIEPLGIDPNALPTHALIDWYAVLLRQPVLPQRDTHLAAAEQVLRARLSFQGNRLVWANETSDFWWWLMASGDASAAKLLSIAVEQTAWKDDVPRLATGLLARFKSGHWLTTNANLLGSLAIERFSQVFERDAVTGGTAGVLRELGGREQTQNFAWSSGATGTLEFAWPQDRKPVFIALAHEGSGKPWASIQTLAAVEIKAPQHAGFRIERSVEPVQVRQAGSYSRGDVLRVRLKITPSAPATWVVVNDPVPAGATILGSGLGRDSQIASRPAPAASGTSSGTWGGAWRAYEERAFDSYRAYYRFVSDRSFELEYTLRLNNPGEFSLPPARIEAMYNPEMFGAVPVDALRVQP